MADQTYVQDYAPRVVRDIVSLSDGATITADWQQGNYGEVTITASRTLAFSNVVAGQVYTVRIQQGGTGSYTITWPSNVAWDSAMAPTLSTAVGDADVVTFRAKTTTTFDGFHVATGVA